MIKLNNISKIFNKRSVNKNQVLNNISCTLPEKGLIAIFGKSGSGKTTLLNILGGLAKPDSGSIEINNKKYHKISDKLRNKEMGFIFQNYYLEKNYKITEIIENQMLIAGITDKKIITEETNKALELVNMARFKNKTADSLSGGQQQRVAIARAIAKQANIILADEPTGNLDSTNTEIVMEILKEISKTKLVVLVTHELSLIEKYADHYIELVDGKITHNIDEQVASEEALTNQAKVGKPTKAGRLFTFKRIFKHLRFASEERFYSLSNIIKQIFIIAFALFLNFFAMQAFEINNSQIKDKAINPNAIYTDLKSYPEIRKLAPDLYQEINFFETNFRDGSFKLKVFDVVEELSLKYIPEAIPNNLEQNNLVQGKLPNDNEILISSGLLKALINKTTIKNLKNNKLANLINFNNNYQVSGVINNNEPKVYFNKAAYLNFLNIYHELSFNDTKELFFKDNFKAKNYLASIKEASDELALDEGILEISRNALYKMLTDSLDADIIVEKVNLELKKAPKLIQVNDSKLYIKKIVITKEPLKSDLNLVISKEVLKNIFVYLKPNINNLENNNQKYNDFYFEIITNNKEALANYFNQNLINQIDVKAMYKERHLEERNNALLAIQIYLIGIVIMFLIYYFFAKAESIKNNKEYAIYRAIGINKTNLLFKELVSSAINNLITFSSLYLISLAFISSYYLINNINILILLLISIGLYLISTLILLFISIIPYLFVIYLMPADILAKYDI